MKITVVKFNTSSKYIYIYIQISVCVILSMGHGFQFACNLQQGNLGRSTGLVLDVASEVCSCRSSAAAFVTLGSVGSTSLPDPSIDEMLVKGCHAQNDLKSVLGYYRRLS